MMKAQKKKALILSTISLLSVGLMLSSQQVKADFTNATASTTTTSGPGGSVYSGSAFPKVAKLCQAAFVYHSPSDTPKDRANEAAWLSDAQVSAPEEQKFVIVQWFHLPDLGNVSIKFFTAVTGDTAIGTQFYTTSSTLRTFNIGSSWSKIKSLTGTTDHINYHDAGYYGLPSYGTNDQYAVHANSTLWFSGTYGPSIGGGASGFGSGSTYGQNQLGGGILWKNNEIVQSIVANGASVLPAPSPGTPVAPPVSQSIQKTATDIDNGQTTATEETTKSASDKVDYSIKFGFANEASHKYNSSINYHDSSKTSYDVTTTEQAFQSVTTITDTLPNGFVIDNSNPLSITTTDGNKIQVTNNSIPNISSNITYGDTKDYAYYKIQGQKITITYVSGDRPTNSQNPNALNNATAVIHGSLSPDKLPSSDPNQANSNFNLNTGVGTISNTATSNETVQEFTRSASTSQTVSSEFINVSNASWSAPKETNTSKNSNTVKLDIQAHRVYGNYLKDNVTYNKNSLSYSPTGNPLGVLPQSDGKLANAFASHWIYPGLTMTFKVPTSQTEDKTVSPTYDMNLPGVVKTTNGPSISYTNSSSTVISGGTETKTDPSYIFVPGQDVQDIEWKPITPLSESGATVSSLTASGLDLGNWGYNSSTTNVFVNFSHSGAQKIPINLVTNQKALVSLGSQYAPKNSTNVTIQATAGFYDNKGFLGEPQDVTLNIDQSGNIKLASAIPNGATAISLYGIGLKWTIGKAGTNYTTWKDNFPGGSLSGSQFNGLITWNVSHGTSQNSNSVETVTVHGGYVYGSSPNVLARGGYYDNNTRGITGTLYPHSEFSGSWANLHTYSVNNAGVIFYGNVGTLQGTPLEAANRVAGNGVRLTVNGNGRITVGSTADNSAPLAVQSSGSRHYYQLLGTNATIEKYHSVQTTSTSYTMTHNYWQQISHQTAGINPVNPSATDIGGYDQSTTNSGGSYEYVDGTDTWSDGTISTTPGQSVTIPNTASTSTKILNPNAILNSSLYTSTWYHDVTDINGNKHSFDHVTNLQTGEDQPISVSNGTYTYSVPNYDSVISMYFGQKAELVNVNHYTDNTNKDSSLWNKSFDNGEVPGNLSIPTNTNTISGSTNNLYSRQKPNVESYLLFEGQSNDNGNAGLNYSPMIQSISDGGDKLWKMVPGTNQNQKFGFTTGSSPKTLANDFITNVLTIPYHKGDEVVNKNANLTINADKIIVDTDEGAKGLPFKLSLTGQAQGMLVNFLNNKPTDFVLKNYNYKIDLIDDNGKNLYSTTTSLDGLTPDSTGQFKQTITGTLNTKDYGNGAKNNFNVVITPLPNGKLPDENYYAPNSTQSVPISQTVTTDTISGTFKARGYNASHLIVTNNKPISKSLSVIETISTPLKIKEYHEYFGINFPTDKQKALTGYGFNASYPYYYGYDTDAQNTANLSDANQLKMTLAYPFGLNDDQSILPSGFNDKNVKITNDNLTTKELTSTDGSTQTTNGFKLSYSNAEMPNVAVNKYNGKVYSYTPNSPAWTNSTTVADGYSNQDHMIFLPLFVRNTPSNYDLHLTSNTFGVNKITVNMSQTINVVGSLHATLNSKTPSYDALWFQPVYTSDPFDYNEKGTLPSGITKDNYDWLKGNNRNSQNPWWK